MCLPGGLVENLVDIETNMVIRVALPTGVNDDSGGEGSQEPVLKSCNTHYCKQQVDEKGKREGNGEIRGEEREWWRKR